MKLFKITTSSEEECHESMGKKGLQIPIFGDANCHHVISQSCLLPQRSHKLSLMFLCYVEGTRAPNGIGPLFLKAAG